MSVGVNGVECRGSEGCYLETRPRCLAIFSAQHLLCIPCWKTREWTWQLVSCSFQVQSCCWVAAEPSCHLMTFTFVSLKFLNFHHLRVTRLFFSYEEAIREKLITSPAAALCFQSMRPPCYMVALPLSRQVFVSSAPSNSAFLPQVGL